MNTNDLAAVPSQDPANAGDPSTQEPLLQETPLHEGVHDELDAVRAQFDEQAARLRAVSKAYTSLQADMDAFRKRQLQTAEFKLRRKQAEVVETFFEPVENLRRMLEAGGDAQALHQGASLILQQFNDRMEQLGLAEIPGVGSVFDPKLHEAIGMMPVHDPSQDGRVVVVHATGYAVGEHVLQPAKVLIGQLQQEANQA